MGLFGGSFNPPHLGHVNSVASVAEQLKLKKVFVIPSYQTPGKAPIQIPTPEQRLEMAKIAFSDYEDLVEVDSREIERKGISYTVETLKEYAKEYSSEQMYLIVGADSFVTFDQWKDYEEILSLASLVVTTRPGYILPFRAEDLPVGIQPHVKSMKKDEVVLKTGRTIDFVHLKDVEISATEVRKLVRSGLRTDKYLTLPLERYIAQHKLYHASTSEPIDFEQVTRFCSNLLFDKKGFNVKGYDLQNVESPCDYALIASGTSTRHVSGLGEHVIKEVKRQFGLNPLSVEGNREGRWVLIDYGALIVHIFYDFIRQEYKLEDLWKKGHEMHLQEPRPTATISFDKRA